MLGRAARQAVSWLHRRPFASIASARLQAKRPADTVPMTNPAAEKALYKLLVKTREFPELILMIKSYLMAGKIEHAETLMGLVRTLRMRDWYDFTTDSVGAAQPAVPSHDEAAGLLNMFVQAHLERDQPEKANEILRVLSRQRNVLTFALLLKHYLGKEQPDKCRKVVREMRASGIQVDSRVWGHLHRTRVLQRAELDRLLPLLHSDQEGTVELDLTDLVEPEAETIAVPTVDLAEVQAIASSSNGIDFVKKALRALKDEASGSVDRYRLQERLERDCLEAASEQFQRQLKHFMEMSKSPDLSRVRRLLCEWYPLLTEHYRRAFDVAGSHEGASPLYAAMVGSLQPEKIAIIVLQELTRISAIDTRLDGIPVARIATNIGACLEREIFAQQIFRKEFLAYVRISAKQRSQVLHDRKAFTRLMERAKELLDDSIEARQAGWIPAWTTVLKAEVRPVLRDMRERWLCRLGRSWQPRPSACCSFRPRPAPASAPSATSWCTASASATASSGCTPRSSRRCPGSPRPSPSSRARCRWSCRRTRGSRTTRAGT